MGMGDIRAKYFAGELWVSMSRFQSLRSDLATMREKCEEMERELNESSVAHREHIGDYYLGVVKPMKSKLEAAEARCEELEKDVHGDTSARCPDLLCKNLEVIAHFRAKCAGLEKALSDPTSAVNLGIGRAREAISARDGGFTSRAWMMLEEALSFFDDAAAARSGQSDEG